MDTTPSNRSKAGLFCFDSDPNYAAEPPPSPKKQMKRTITVSMDYQSCPSPIKRQNKMRAQDSSQTPNQKTNNTEHFPLSETHIAPKRALSAGFAESFRAVFAAFLWHEGLVHDAMACATYLKFHPMLPKRNALSFANDELRQDVCLSKEQRARQRYSVEVANAGNYLNIRPSTLETLNKSGQSSILNRRNRKMNADVSCVFFLTCQ